MWKFYYKHIVISRTLKKIKITLQCILLIKPLKPQWLPKSYHYLIQLKANFVFSTLLKINMLNCIFRIFTSFTGHYMLMVKISYFFWSVCCFIWVKWIFRINLNNGRSIRTNSQNIQNIDRMSEPISWVSDLIPRVSRI